MCVHIYMYICMFTRICMCVCVCVCTCMRVCVYAHVCNTVKYDLSHYYFYYYYYFYSQTINYILFRIPTIILLPTYIKLVMLHFARNSLLRLVCYRLNYRRAIFEQINEVNLTFCYFSHLELRNHTLYDI